MPRLTLLSSSHTSYWPPRYSGSMCVYVMLFALLRLVMPPILLYAQLLTLPLACRLGYGCRRIYSYCLTLQLQLDQRTFTLDFGRFTAALAIMLLQLALSLLLVRCKATLFHIKVTADYVQTHAGQVQFDNSYPTHSTLLLCLDTAGCHFEYTYQAVSYNQIPSYQPLMAMGVLDGVGATSLACSKTTSWCGLTYCFSAQSDGQLPELIRLRPFCLSLSLLHQFNSPQPCAPPGLAASSFTLIVTHVRFYAYERSMLSCTHVCNLVWQRVPGLLLCCGGGTVRALAAGWLLGAGLSKGGVCATWYIE